MKQLTPAPVRGKTGLLYAVTLEKKQGRKGKSPTPYSQLRGGKKNFIPQWDEKSVRTSDNEGYVRHSIVTASQGNQAHFNPLIMTPLKGN